jgi:hypothetical protein
MPKTPTKMAAPTRRIKRREPPDLGGEAEDVDIDGSVMVT